MLDFLGKRFPKEQDADLAKVQTAILASFRPLHSAWQHLMEEGLESNPEKAFPASEVLSLVQQTICLIGSASEYISQMRCTRILTTIDITWSKYWSGEYLITEATLFGDHSQLTLYGKVERGCGPIQSSGNFKEGQCKKGWPHNVEGA